MKFPVSAVRPQGLPAGGVAGIKLGKGDQVLFFSSVTENPDASVLTVSGNSGEIPGTVPGRGKISLLEDFPAKGRATQGVRAHRFRADEDQLELAWSGPHRPVATTAGGVAAPLPEELGKRDGSGEQLSAVTAYVG